MKTRFFVFLGISATRAPLSSYYMSSLQIAPSLKRSNSPTYYYYMYYVLPQTVEINSGGGGFIDRVKLSCESFRHIIIIIVNADTRPARGFLCCAVERCPANRYDCGGIVHYFIYIPRPSTIIKNDENRVRAFIRLGIFGRFSPLPVRAPSPGIFNFKRFAAPARGVVGWPSSQILRGLVIITRALNDTCMLVYMYIYEYMRMYVRACV